MLDWLKKIFEENEKKEVLKWRTHDSILAYFRRNIDKNGSIKESAYNLPDEKETGGIKFAPGLTDAMFGADTSEASKKRLRKLAKLIDRIARQGDEESKAEFYQEITENEGVIGIIDEFLDNILREALNVDPYLYHFAYELATKTNQRNSVKFGIAILALCHKNKPLEDIKILGLHDEFTLYAVVALSELSENLVQDLWYLAKRIDGWGKIQLVGRMVEQDLPEEIRDWLIYEGYSNSIMDEYLALSCAIHGKLNEKLEQASIDSRLFSAAGEIIRALLDEGPAEGMSGFADSAECIHNYLRHAKEQDLKILDFIILNELKEYLENAQENTEESALKNWSQDDFSNNLIDINELLQSKDWLPKTMQALESLDKQEYWNAKRAGQMLGLDMWDTFWNRLAETPEESMTWYDVATNLKTGFEQAFVEKALELLPLDEICTGPEDSMAFGPDYHKHASLEYVLEKLGDMPGLGEELILAGLQSPITRNRNVCLKSLEKWTSKYWSQEILSELGELAMIEPNEDTQENIRKLIYGEPLE